MAFGNPYDVALDIGPCCTCSKKGTTMSASLLEGLLYVFACRVGRHVWEFKRTPHLPLFFLHPVLDGED